MGEVFEAEDSQLGRLVAIKIMSGQFVPEVGRKTLSSAVRE
jgi:hypothetical protein